MTVVPAAAPRRPAAVGATLREEILRGDIPRGAPLREESLAERFGVSRSTVRNALRVLLQEHLAVAEPYRGVRVTDLTAVQVTELQQVRCALESEAVRILQQRHGTERWPAIVMAPINHCLEAMREASSTPAPDPRAVDLAHSRLHLAVVEASGNVRLLEHYRELDAELRMALLYQRSDRHPRHVFAVHREYVSQLPRRGDAAVREHITPQLEGTRRPGPL